MDLNTPVLLGVKIIMAFLAATAGIAFWSHTRDLAWVFIILGVLASFIEVLVQFLELLGIFSLDMITFQGVSLIPLVFSILVPGFFLVGFIIALKHFFKP
jgi:hypothetical protein